MKCITQVDVKNILGIPIGLFEEAVHVSKGLVHRHNNHTYHNGEYYRSKT